MKSRGVRAIADYLRQIRFSVVAHSQDALVFLLGALYSEIWAATEGGVGREGDLKLIAFSESRSI